MNKEKMKKILEQIRSKKHGNNEANGQVASMLNATNEGNGEGGNLESGLFSVDNYVFLNPVAIDGTEMSNKVLGNYMGRLWALEGYVDVEGLLKANGVLSDNECLGSIEIMSCRLKLFGVEGNYSSEYMVYAWNETEATYITTLSGGNTEIEVPLKCIYAESGNFKFLLEPSETTGYIGFTDNGELAITYKRVPRSLTEIKITEFPTKTVYLEGEKFDPSGMVVTATYSDGSTAEVTGYYSPDRALTASDTSITISYTEGDVTKTATQTITVYPMTNVYYGDNLAPSVDERNLQSMDIYIPKNEDETYKEGPFPAVITIHGGNWSVGVTKEYYNYMTEFITGDCDCVQVNMEYRRMGAGGGLATDEGALAPYKQMLEDIQSVIEYLQDNASAYHIDASKIALMGWSAGGHLALLYAYSTAGNYDNSTENPVKLVISEAGPTNFLLKDGNGNPISPDPNVCNLVGITDYSADNTKLFEASPISYVAVEEGKDAVDVPYTILAYGNGISCGILGDGDGTVAYSQATSLMAELDATFEDTSNGSETNASQVIEGENCTLFKLYSVGHNDFGENVNGTPKKIHPDVEIKEDDKEEDIEQKTVILNYYDKISTELQKLKPQENN